ncbi:hypothetical protein AGMMS50262_03780 [Bacteroidia bacterium]|nr:hypothetical protein AGMMS50262_03780 [Bacteroidia bacterium]
MKRLGLVLCVLVSVCVSNVKAQEFSVGADFVSSYVWRGIYQGGGASVQPNAALAVGGFSIGAWGSTNLGGGNKEVDFTLGYEVAGLSLAVTDYWWAGEEAYKYFAYDKDKTEHLYEVTFGYTLPVEKFPLSLKWNTFFAGSDFFSLKEDGTADRSYSTYIEAAYPFSIKDVNLEAALGFTPWEGLYASKFSVVNIHLKASKEIKITENFSLPVFGQIIVNPHSEDIFFVFGVSL